MKIEKQALLDIEDAQLRRNAAALQASNIGVFEFEPQSAHAFWDDRIRQLWGVAADVEITYDDVVIVGVHPDDRAYHDERTAQALDPAGDGHLDITYRLWPLDGGPMRWIRAVADTKFENGTAIRLVGTVEDITERKLAEERSTFLMGELQHRLKNTLAIVTAVIKRSRAGYDDVEAYAAALEARVKALSDSHDILLRANWSDVPFQKIVETVFHDFYEDAARLEVTEGPAVVIPEKNVLTVSLAAYELLSNSIKHGALSRPDGRVVLSTEAGPDGAVIEWREIDSQVHPDGAFARNGFGSFLLHRVVAHELGAKVDYGVVDGVATFTLRSANLRAVTP